MIYKSETNQIYNYKYKFNKVFIFMVPICKLLDSFHYNFQISLLEWITYYHELAMHICIHTQSYTKLYIDYVIVK